MQNNAPQFTVRKIRYTDEEMLKKVDLAIKRADRLVEYSLKKFPINK